MQSGSKYQSWYKCIFYFFFLFSQIEQDKIYNTILCYTIIHVLGLKENKTKHSCVNREKRERGGIT